MELNRTLRLENKTTWQSLISEYKTLEARMCEGFQNHQTKRLREGNLKTSFIYLLIDPRISENLPVESHVSNFNYFVHSDGNIYFFVQQHFQVISKYDAWRRFLSSIFYVGKGKCSRPYAHLYDAIKLYQSEIIVVCQCHQYLY